MANDGESQLRSLLGPNLQVAALRSVLVLAVLAFLGAGCTWLFH